MRSTRIWLAAVLIALLALSASRPAPADACSELAGYWVDRFLDGELEWRWEGEALVFSGILEERSITEGVAWSTNVLTVDQAWKGRISAGNRIVAKSADTPWAPCPARGEPRIGERHLAFVVVVTPEGAAQYEQSEYDPERWPPLKAGDLAGYWYYLGPSDKGLEELLEALDELSERDPDLPQYDPYGRPGWPAIGALVALAAAIVVYQRRISGFTRA